MKENCSFTFSKFQRHSPHREIIFQFRIDVMEAIYQNKCKISRLYKNNGKYKMQFINRIKLGCKSTEIKL